MKSIKLLFALLLTLAMTSCTITEKMIINDNGSGKFAYDIDGTKMMSMMGSAFKGDDKEDTKKDKKETVNRKNKKVVDSTFTFKEMFASKQDSISKLSPEEQAKIKKMERFSVRTIIDEEKGIMNYSMFTDFNSISELQDVMSPVESMKSISPTGKKSGGMGMAPDALEDNSSTSFFYDGKTFKKTVAKIEKKKDVTEEVEEGSEDDVANKMKESLDMFYDQSNFKVVYQFPKAVKKISIENALYSEDRKTITIEYPLKDYMENPDKLNFEVTFE
ncbi:hypothetical protein [Flavobacterium sp.]|jgi:hypothetical protein|uniref:hypothetical protein n=1 Tax=Flavobacterium sp. TaxID=239 RepID=UPI0037BECBFC